MVRLYSNGIDLDLGEFATTLTFSIADIREPDKRNASFSKTLTLPGTKANNKFFENMFEVDVVTQTFNPNLKALTILSVDGVTQFKGALKLRQVNYLVGGQVTYDCNLIGNLGELFQEMGNLRLRDLDLSSYNHTYTQTNVEASWSPTLGTGYVYPMVNYGENSDLNNWDIIHFRPALFAKTILDKIFTDAGFIYTSTFLNSDLFKRLIIPNSQDKLRLTGDQVNTRLFKAGKSTSQVTTLPTSVDTLNPVTLIINNDSTGGYFDNDGNFNTSTYKHEPTYNGFNTYLYSNDVQIDLTFNQDISTANDFSSDVVIQIIQEESGIETILNSQYLSMGAGLVNTGVGTESFTFNKSFNLAAENISVYSGKKIFVRLQSQVNSVLSTLTSAQVTITNQFFSDTIVNDLVGVNDTIVMSNTLPDMLQKDFVIGLIRMFNLYIEPDKDNETLLNIEPRDTYYNTTQVDWSAKLATEKELGIEPMALLNFKRIVAQYKDDSDYYNKIYKQEYTRNYGSYLADVTNDFVNGDYKIETTFSPTPLVGNFENDRIIPTILQSTSGTPPTVEPFGALPRILYWGGLKNCETWTFREFVIPSYKTQYPYAGHLDDPQAPTIDLSFGIPQKVYYGVNQYISSLTYTDNNLYNTYYSQMISEITDRDSKLVTGYFWLTPVDILNLDFRKIYRVGSHALRLNKIYDYNPVKSNLTKCEFIKIKDTSTFVSNSEIMNGGIDIVVNSRENAPVIDMSTFQDGNVVARPSTTVITGEKNYAGGGLSTWIGGQNNRVHGRNSSGVVITGEDNIVQDGASGVVIHGYNNTVGFGAKNLFIQGDRNTIAPNLSNVTLIKSTGVTVTESNTLYIDSIRRYSDTVYFRETGWTYSNNKNLNSSPNQITELVAQADKIILIKELLFCLDAGAVAYNFANNIKLRYTGGNVIVDIDKAIINSATDYYYHVTGINAAVSVGQGVELYSAADAAAGNGLYYYKIIYEVISKPF